MSEKNMDKKLVEAFLEARRSINRRFNLDALRDIAAGEIPAEIGEALDGCHRQFTITNDGQVVFGVIGVWFRTYTKFDDIVDNIADLAAEMCRPLDNEIMDSVIAAGDYGYSEALKSVADAQKGGGEGVREAIGKFESILERIYADIDALEEAYRDGRI